MLWLQKQPHKGLTLATALWLYSTIGMFMLATGDREPVNNWYVVVVAIMFQIFSLILLPKKDLVLGSIAVWAVIVEVVTWILGVKANFWFYLALFFTAFTIMWIRKEQK